MSRPIDWTKPVGTVNPPWNGAHVEQGGHYYDLEGNEVIIPGVTPSPAAEAAAQQPPVQGAIAASPQAVPGAVPQRDGYTEADLILMADDNAITFQFLRKYAREVLDDCPGDKEGIVKALKDAIVKKALATTTYEPIDPSEAIKPMLSVAGMAAQPVAKPVTQQTASVQQTAVPTVPPVATPAPKTAAEPAPSPPSAPAQQSAKPPKDNGAVDLKAWGEGKEEYRWSEIQKAIRAKYSKQVSEKPDAIDLLIEEGVIQKDDAREVEYSKQPFAPSGESGEAAGDSGAAA